MHSHSNGKFYFCFYLVKNLPFLKTLVVISGVITEKENNVINQCVVKSAIYESKIDNIWYELNIM